MKKSQFKSEKIRFLPVGALVPNSALPHRFGTDEGADALTRSISRYGILHPILVRECKDGYRVLCGSRRLRAARALGMETVPCRVMDLSEREGAELIFAENTHRKDLIPAEEAAVAYRLQKAYPYRYGELADRIGAPPSQLAAKLRLMHFSPEERELFTRLQLHPDFAEPILHLRERELRLFAMRHIGEKGYGLEEASRLCLSLALHPEEFSPPVRGDSPPKRGVRRFVIRDVRFLINSVDRAVSSIRGAGFDVECDKAEDEDAIEYLIRIPKP